MTEPATAAPAAGAPKPPPSPYRGLRSYTEADTAFFFGREAEAEIIAANLLGARLTLLYGPSGVGKSSVLLAGVVSALRERSRENLADEDAAGFAVVVVRSWSDPDPLKTIAAAARAQAAALLERDDLPDPPPGATLAEVLDHWSAQVRGKLLVLFDQFEEYFLYHDHESGPGTFDAEFPQAVNRAELRANFLLSIRDDSLARLDRFKGRIPNLFDNRLQIDHLTLATARDAVKLPIEEYNRRVSPEQRVEIEEELVNDVLGQVRTDRVSRESEGAGAMRDSGTAEARVETPILQVVLTALWEKEVEQGSQALRARTLVELGGAGQLVRDRLDERMTRLDPGEQDVAADVARFLVTPSGTKIAYTSADLTQLAYPNPDLAASKYPQVESVLEKLAKGDARILRPVQPLGAEGPRRYELFHDILAEPILAWRRRYVQQREQQAETERRREARLRLVLLAGIAVALLLIFAGVASWSWTERRHALGQERLARSTVIAFQGLDSGNDLQQRLLASLAANAKKPTYEARTTALRTLQEAAAAHLVAILVEPTGFESVAVSRDFRTIATAGDDGVVRLWDARSHTELAALEGHTDKVESVAISPNGKTVASTGDDTTVRLWDVATHERIARRYAHFDFANSVQFSPDGKLLVSGGTDSRVILWRLGTQRRVTLRRWKVLNTAAQVFATAFSRNGTILAVAGGDGIVRLFHPDGSRRPFQKITVASNLAVYGVTFSPNGKLLATSAASLNDLKAPAKKRVRSVRVWDIHTGRQVGAALPGRGAAYGIAFSPDGAHLAFGSNDGKIRLWQMTAPRHLVMTLTGHESRVWILAFDRTGSFLASASADGSTRIWHVPAAGQPSRRVPVEEAAFSADGETLATLGNDHFVRIWRPGSPNRLIRKLPVPRAHGGGALAISPDGETLAMAGRSVQLWDLRTGAHLTRVAGNGPSGVSAALGGSDGKVLAFATGTGLRLLRVTAPHRIANAFRPDDGVYIEAVAFGRDGTLAAGGDTLWLLRAPYRKHVQIARHDVSPETAPPVTALSSAWSPQGDLVAFGTSGGTIFLWSRNGSRVVGRLTGHDGAVTSLAFSEKGTMLMSGGRDGTVRLWDIPRRRQLGAPFRSGGSAIKAVAFDHGGTSFSSVDASGDIRVWRGFLWKDTADLKRRICRLISGDLTQDDWSALSGDLFRTPCLKVGAQTG